MAFTATDLSALETAIKAGQRRVKFDGIETEYHSVDEMLKAYEFIKSQLEASGAVTPSKRVSYSAFCKD